MNDVMNMSWTNQQRAFAVETYFRKNECVAAIQRTFRTRFKILPRQAIPDRKSIILWVNNFRETGSVIRNGDGRPRTARTAENIDAVRQSFLKSPKPSPRKHTATLQFSDRFIKRILHKDLFFHLYKIMVVQELSVSDWRRRVVAYEKLIETLPNAAVLFFNDEAHFYLSGYVNKQSFQY